MAGLPSDGYPPSLYSSTHRQLVVGARVCRAWARAVRSAIRRRVVIGPRELYDPRSRNVVRALRWLGARPLAVTVYGRGPEDEGECDATDKLVDFIAECDGLRELYWLRSLEYASWPVLPASVVRLRIESWYLTADELAFMVVLARPEHLSLDTRALLKTVTEGVGTELSASMMRLRSLSVNVGPTWITETWDQHGISALEVVVPDLEHSMLMAIVKPVASELRHFGATGLSDAMLRTLRAQGVGDALETLSIAEGTHEDDAPHFIADEGSRVRALDDVLSMISPRIRAIHLALSLANFTSLDRLEAWAQVVDSIVGRLERGELPHLAELRFDEALGALPSSQGLGGLDRARRYVRTRARLCQLCEERGIARAFTSDL